VAFGETGAGQAPQRDGGEASGRDRQGEAMEQRDAEQGCGEEDEFDADAEDRGETGDDRIMGIGRGGERREQAEQQ